MGYLAPNVKRKKIRLKAQDPEHEAAGLRKRTYGMNGELLKAETPEGQTIHGDPLRMRDKKPPALGGGLDKFYENNPHLKPGEKDQAGPRKDPFRPASRPTSTPGSIAGKAAGSVVEGVKAAAEQAAKKSSSPLRSSKAGSGGSLGGGLEQFYRNNPRLKRGDKNQGGKGTWR